MFEFLKRRFRQGTKIAPLDAVRFDTRGFSYQGEPQPGNLRVWHTSEGDGFGFYSFPIAPDLPIVASRDALLSFYQTQLQGTGGKLVQLDVIATEECSIVRTIISAPQQPSGRTYVGSITLPFRDFSYVMKCQCAEHGTTGVKEALLFERSRAANEPLKIVNGEFHIPGWNPDDVKHDREFSDHPVARARRVLDQIVASLKVAEVVRKLPTFPLLCS